MAWAQGATAPHRGACQKGAVTLEQKQNINEGFSVQCAASSPVTPRLAPLSGPAVRVRAASGPTLSEVFPEASSDAAAVGFVLSQLPGGMAPLFWVQDRLSRLETGLPYLPGLGPRPVIRVEVNRPVDVLWALEEALRCRALAMAIGEVWGQPKALDFTASTRLALRAERYGVPCWLIRRSAAPDLSASRARWRVAALPSAAHPDDAQAPGDPRWRIELFRARDAQPGAWVARHDRAADRVDLVAASGDGPLAEDHGPEQQRAAR